MPMRRMLVAAVAMLAAAPAAAEAQSRDLWTTVNLCNTPAHPNEMGVRGRMPGDGTHTKMYMRFTAQYRDPESRSWVSMVGDGQSPWIYAGSALVSHQETGFTFSFDPPQAGDRFVFRGVADFQWRARKRSHGKLHMAVVRSERMHTEAGHPAAGAEPAGYSSAACVMEGPAG
jgi:hypothetical protein